MPLSSVSRGSTREATHPTPAPNAKPSPTSWSTNLHHTKSWSADSAAVRASTGGSARPSLRPDSRLSEWRMIRGTRGFVTTLEESTGSVGDSSAPSRNDSVHERSVSTCAATATIPAVSGIASTSLRSGRCHARWSISPSTSSPSRNRITTSAATARPATNPDDGSGCSTSAPPLPSTKPMSTKTAVSDRKLRRAMPETSAPKTSSAPRTIVSTSKSWPAPAASMPSCATAGSMRIGFQMERVERLRITVLGKSPSWQDADGACSGYLIEEAGTCLLVDCGNGVFSKLRRFRDYVAVDAVVISHLHADHFLDLVPFSYALTYAPRQQPVPVDRWPGTDRPARPLLYAPRGATETFRRVVGAWGNDDLIENAFDLHEYDPLETVTVGPLSFSFAEVPHFVHTCAIDVTSSLNGGGRFVYGADSAPANELVDFATGADLLMIEATLPRPERGGMRGHLTPGEAGEHGARAGVRRLVLTHMSDELDALWARREAEKTFGGPVDLAHEGAVYEL